jgi:hypothetical protein
MAFVSKQVFADGRFGLLTGEENCSAWNIMRSTGRGDRARKRASRALSVLYHCNDLWERLQALHHSLFDAFTICPSHSIQVRPLALQKI